MHRSAEFLHAFILGVEVECRIGNAVCPQHYDIGWHITGTAGVFGAAAAAGKNSRTERAANDAGHLALQARSPPGSARCSARCARASIRAELHRTWIGITPFLPSGDLRVRIEFWKRCGASLT